MEVEVDVSAASVAVFNATSASVSDANFLMRILTS